jgi:hypothetical protein
MSEWPRGGELTPPEGSDGTAPVVTRDPPDPEGKPPHRGQHPDKASGKMGTQRRRTSGSSRPENGPNAAPLFPLRSPRFSASVPFAQDRPTSPSRWRCVMDLDVVVTDRNGRPVPDSNARTSRSVWPERPCRSTILRVDEGAIHAGFATAAPGSGCRSGADRGEGLRAAVLPSRGHRARLSGRTK